MPYMSNTEAARYLLDKEQHVKAEKFLHAFELFWDLNAGISGNLVKCLLLVSLKPGGGPTDYAKDLEVTSGQVSRWMLELGERGRNNHAGHGLIQRLGGSEDLREVHYVLTPKGRAFVKKFTDRLGIGTHG